MFARPSAMTSFSVSSGFTTAKDRVEISTRRAMFDPFNDFETAGYLRNVRKDKDPRDIKHFEHDLFEMKLGNAFDYLATRPQLEFRDFLAVHKILFSAY
jgi:fido (protein-threonine AMPylation protein)